MAEAKEGEAETERNFLFELPADILRLICSLVCAGDSIILSRCISKSLTSTLSLLLITPTIPMSIQAEPHPEIPYLLTLQEDYVLKFYHPILAGFHRTQIPELLDSRILFSNHGWLLMSTIHYDLFFFNPFSKEKIQLPKYPPGDSFHQLYFNLPPTSPDCFVMDVTFYRYHIIRRGQETWTTCRDDIDTQKYILSPGVAPVFMLDGSCCCLGKDGSLGMFHLEDNHLHWNVMGDKYPSELQDSLRRCFLVKKNEGELLRILEIGEDRRIQVSSIDITSRSMAWSPEKRSFSENKMLFLGLTCFLESSDLRGMQNKIFLPMLHNDVNLFYSLSAERYLSFHGDYSSNHCFGGVKDFYHSSAWIKPSSPTATIIDESFKW